MWRELPRADLGFRTGILTVGCKSPAGTQRNCDSAGHQKAEIVLKKKALSSYRFLRGSRLVVGTAYSTFAAKPSPVHAFLRSMRAVLAVAYLAGAGCRAGLVAAGPGTGTSREVSDAPITGIVRNASGAPVSGVSVTLKPPVGLTMKVVTGSDGKFAFEGVKPGTYMIQADSPGFESTMRSDVLVEGRKRLVIDLQLLHVRAGGAKPDAASLGQTATASGAPARAEVKASNGHPSSSGKTSSAPGKVGLEEFEYYDNTGLKPGNASMPVSGAGYSSAKQVDSYTLMLNYIDAETRAAGTGARDHSSGRPSEHTQQSPAPALSRIPGQYTGWTESDYLSRGSGFMLNHELEAAVDAFQAGVARFPDSAKLHTGLGIVLLARGEYQRAVKSLLRATDLAPSDPQTYFVLAKSYRGSNPEVLARLERLVTLQPHDAQARYCYALALGKGTANEQTLRRVESLLRSATALDPAFADAHLELGNVYQAEGQYSSALPEYQAAVRLKPDLAAAHYRLAQVYKRNGDKPGAQREFEAYERLQGGNPKP